MKKHATASSGVDAQNSMRIHAQQAWLQVKTALSAFGVVDARTSTRKHVQLAGLQMLIARAVNQETNVQIKLAIMVWCLLMTAIVSI
jgi:hypothetical protein